MLKILVVVADAVLRDRMLAELDASGDEARGVASGDDALRLVSSEPFDLVILDLMLPALDGFDICRQLRRDGVPHILLVAEPDGVTEQLAREIGADDLLIAPFEMHELVDRVREFAPAEPAEPEPEPALVLDAGELHIDLASHQVRRGGQLVSLKPKEMELLDYLVRRRGEVCSTRALLGEVWGYEYFGDSRTLAVHIHGLREKLGDDPAEPHLIQTVRGVGYRFMS